MISPEDLSNHIIVRKSDSLKKYENTMCENWDFSQQKMKEPIKETDLTGPEYSPKIDHAHKKESPAVNKKKRDSLKTSGQNFPNVETAVFYTTLDGDSCGSNSSQPSLDALKLEDLPDDHKENTTFKLKNKDKCSNMITEPASPSDPPKPKLWSCFPAIKTSNKRNSYKMVMQSPPYMPVARENTSRYVATHFYVKKKLTINDIYFF